MERRSYFKFKWEHDEVVEMSIDKNALQEIDAQIALQNAYTRDREILLMQGGRQVTFNPERKIFQRPKKMLDANDIKSIAELADNRGYGLTEIIIRKKK
ncbi:MAG: hypothetical protein QG600_851 [Patescibacteria group bacterium]|jgi:dissimilatory sulfite reductase (desulfoviridin) alpha/beta subunit|nr:hypothetical protein [Patescibacteria group bacterium]